MDCGVAVDSGSLDRLLWLATTQCLHVSQAFMAAVAHRFWAVPAVVRAPGLETALLGGKVGARALRAVRVCLFAAADAADSRAGDPCLAHAFCLLPVRAPELPGGVLHYAVVQAQFTLHPQAVARTAPATEVSAVVARLLPAGAGGAPRAAAAAVSAAGSAAAAAAAANAAAAAAPSAAVGSARRRQDKSSSSTSRDRAVAWTREVKHALRALCLEDVWDGQEPPFVRLQLEFLVAPRVA